MEEDVVRDSRFNFLTSLELIGNLLWEYLVKHISRSDFGAQACILLVNQWFCIVSVHVRKDHIQILCFWTEIIMSTPTFCHDLFHSLRTRIWNRWSVVDAWVADLSQDLSWMETFIWDLSTIDLVNNHS